MTKIADFIVEKRIAILVILIALTVACTFISFSVEINVDMTKYLSDESQMKMGLDVMEQEWPGEEEIYTIRVMVTGLDASQKDEVRQALAAIEYVDSVDTDADDADYNRDDHTLFIINTSYEYTSRELAEIERTLEQDFDQYDLTYKNDEASDTSLPLWIVALALFILLVILLVMSASWIEPLLFIITIGLAILINMGTNIFLGSISNVTWSISAILQLALSMDYSIILINRYRQELELTDDIAQAMKTALRKSFSSISSSAATTIVGLIMLVFMSYKIGFDLGVVLAKGVFISMLCVFAALPGLILLFDRLIKKTAKPVPLFSMRPLAAFSFKFRYFITGAFVLIFIGAFILKANTGYTYSLQAEDPIADIFPATSTVVMIYDNADEDAIARLGEELEKNQYIKEIQGYTTTLGRQYTARELAAELETYDLDMELDASMLAILYYHYYSGGETGTIAVSDFLDFLAGDVLENETFAEYIGDELLGNIETIKKFADADALTQSLNADEMADFFDMDAGSVGQLYLLYFIENGGVATGTMTLPVFADFVVNHVAADPDYAEMFDAGTLSQMRVLLTYTDAAKMTRPVSYEEIAATLGMDSETAKLLFVYYYAMSPSYEPGTTTLPELVAFLSGDVASNPMFASYLGEGTAEQLSMLATFTNRELLLTEMTGPELAQLFGMDPSMTQQLLSLYHGDQAGENPAMTPHDFVNFLVDVVLQDETYSALFDAEAAQQLVYLQTIIRTSVYDAELSYVEAAALFGMDADTMRMLCTYNDANYGDTSSWRLSVQTVVNFLVDNGLQFGQLLDSATLSGLKTAQKIINGSVTGTRYTPGDLASLTGMDSEQAGQLYLLYISEYGDTSGWTLSAQAFVDFIIADVLGDPDMAEYIDESAAYDLKTADTLIDAVISGEAYDAAGLAQLFVGLADDLDADMMGLMYLYYFSLSEGDDDWTLSIMSLFSYLSETIVDDPAFDTVLDASFREDIADMQAELDDGESQLKGDTYSRLILTTTIPPEGAEATEFFDNLHNMSAGLTGSYYLIGNSVMNYEMSQSFDSEMNYITLLTAIAIFVVVALTFRSLVIPMILVLIIQCGVFITICAIGLQGYDIYYLALLIVQCILMGATIDYGILFTSYYREKRRIMDQKTALAASYLGSMHTVMTSGLIMILITGILGYCFENPIVGQICWTIAIGALCATMLIIFVLPGILATFDKLVCKDLGAVRKKKVKK